MSYTRKYNETITVSGSKTVSVSYPASKDGGRHNVTVDYIEHVPVDVNIHVDTEPFDNSVQNCNTNVNLLTGAVAATEAAQIASIDSNSKKVANTIISGFFGYIRSEISQQVAELSLNIDAQLMHLKELAQSVLAKKKQMESDYNRISSRYVRVFDDLNNELSNRIYELDKPTFVFKKETDNQKIRTSGNDLVNTVAISGAETGGLHSKISASIAKKRALDAINNAITFLWQQKKLNTTIQRSTFNENIANSKYSPVCFIEAQNEKSQIDTNLFTPNYLTTMHDSSTKKELLELFSKNSNSWDTIPKEYNNDLNTYFNSELNKSYPSADQHSVRVREMIQKIANISSIKIIHFQKV